MLKRLKRIVLRTLRFFGVFRLFRESEWRRKQLLIIGYHGISIDDEHLWDPAFYVTPEALDARFRALRDGGYSVLPLGEAVERLAAGSLPPRSVVLTFDDGLADFAINAYPLLAKYGFPATVYLTTYYSGYNRPVFGVFCSYILWKSTIASLRAQSVLPEITTNEVWELRSASGRAIAHSAIVTYARDHSLSAHEKDALARRLAVAVGINFDQLFEKRILRLVTPQEVARLEAAGVDFQLHTHRHRTPVDRELFTAEIEDNRRELSSMTGKTADHFCYPSGVYHPEFFEWLRALGVRSATTCDSGIATSRTDHMRLPRLIDTSNLDLIEFESWLTGVGALLPLRAHFPVH